VFARSNRKAFDDARPSAASNGLLHTISAAFLDGEMLWWRQSSVGHVQLTQEAFQDSQQGRHLHLAVRYPRRPLAVATVHLESEAKTPPCVLRNSRRTLEQLQGTGMPFLLAGDTNIGKNDDKMISGDKKMLKDVNDGKFFR